MTMHAVSVSVDEDNGDVIIMDGDESNTISVHPHQMETLITWLKMAALKGQDIINGAEQED